MVVHVPDLPGCISQGASFEDAALNIDSAIEDYLAALDIEDQASWTVTTSSDLFSEATTAETPDVRWASTEIAAA